MSEEEKIGKVVCDTNVILSALLWEASAFHFIEKTKDRLIFFTSKAILDELREILARDFYLSDEKIELKISNYLALCRVVEKIDARMHVVARDPDDDKVIECAVEANVNYIITYDRDLLDLAVFQNIKILKPEELLKELTL